MILGVRVEAGVTVQFLALAEQESQSMGLFGDFGVDRLKAGATGARLSYRLGVPELCRRIIPRKTRIARSLGESFLCNSA